MLGGILANYIGRKRSMTLTAGADAAIAHADSRHRVIDLEPPCRVERAVERAALSCPSSLAGSQVAGSDRAGLVEQPTLVSAGFGWC